MNVGTTFVDETFSDLLIDEEWAVREPRGFTWWGSGQATRVWAEPAFEDNGFRITRIHGSTDLVRGGRADAIADTGIAALGRVATLSGFVRDKARNRLRLETSMFIHDETAKDTHRIFSVATALQAEEATRFAPMLASLIGGEIDETAHPESGKRTDRDDILNVREAVVVPEGRSSSKWAGEEMLQLLGQLQTCSLLANGDKGGLTAEFPFLNGSSLLQLLTDSFHPTLGSGLLVLFTLPITWNKEERTALAVELNRLEVAQITRTHFLGSWCEAEERESVTYASFLPNVLYRPGMLMNLGMSFVQRAKWVAEEVFGDDWTHGRGKSAAENLYALSKQKSFLGRVVRRRFGWA